MPDVVYLTFDDGPSASVTPLVLDELERRGALATFFQEGRRVAEHPELTRQLREAGHLIGNHAWTHTDLGTVDDQQLERELLDTSNEIEQAGGGRPRVFRPPFGAMGATEAARERVVGKAAALGMRTVLWHVDSRDDEQPGVDGIVRKVVDGARPDAVVLLHDRLGDTGVAVGRILDELSGRGFAFETLPPGRDWLS